MPRLLVSLVTVGAALGASAIARAESYPQPPTCDASTALPAVTELPAGCPLATFAAIPRRHEFEPAQPPVVFVTRPDGSPVPIDTAIATSWTTMPGRISYCDPYSCSDEVNEGPLEAVRYDVVFLQTPPVGSRLEFSGISGTRRIAITAPGACPEVVAPSVTCEMPRCGSPASHCMQQPDPLCDGGVTPYPPRDGGPSYPRYPDARYDYPDDDHDHHHGCSTTGAAAASPLLLVGLALVLRRRRRYGQPSTSGSANG